MSDVEITVLVALVMVVGLAGTVVPLLPGLMLIWAAALVYGFGVGFGSVGVAVMVLLSLIVVISLVKSILVPRRAAEGHDVSRWSQLVALVGAVIGFFLVPVIGVFVGALVGLLLAEYVNHRDLATAWRATVAVTKGFGLSVVIDVGLAMTMIGLWLVWAFVVVT